MILENYVPLTGDDWYQRRRQDTEGEFFRQVAAQAGRGKVHENSDGGATRQGVYLFTADGTLLGHTIATRSVERTYQVLQRGLRQWHTLPKDKRQPGAVHVEAPGTHDRRYTRTPPANGLIVHVHARILDKDAHGRWRKGSCDVLGGDQASHDRLWLTEAEWRSLIPPDPKVDTSAQVPAAVLDRMTRYHLVDNTRGEPAMWKPEEVRTRELTLTVTEVTPERVRLQLVGAALMATHSDLAQAERGFDARLEGIIEYDVARQTMSRFDLVAVGHPWGESKLSPRARAGRQPFGVAFELATGDTPANRVPPQGARNMAAYLGTAR
ncbi:MAG: hypothetical protein FJZ47_06540 [Candidatus Tectomicrobia bacterium]|uniref:Uncharacterized protein n=1 Tax=Tectimicrobiota bacterium TaxID=2528274 RepID=A0A938B358_UNCTE|nr:hypothetical protein [Candidatus Tectomicrobia bacterium]